MMPLPTASWQPMNVPGLKSFAHRLKIQRLDVSIIHQHFHWNDLEYCTVLAGTSFRVLHHVVASLRGESMAVHCVAVHGVMA